MAKRTSIELYKGLVEELKSGQAKPVYFCCGQEVFFLDRIQQLVTDSVPVDQRDFNMDVLYGQDTNLDRILSICRSFPMMADRRVVIVCDFFNLTSRNEADPENSVSSNLDDLIPYVENPNPGTLLLILDEKKPAGNTRLGKSLKSSKFVGFYEFEPVPDYRLSEWIQEWTEIHHQKEIDAAAAEYLAQFVGNNLLQLTTEIDKLSTYIKENSAISREDIQKLVGGTKEYSVFELKDALVARDEVKSLFIAERMLHLSESDTGEVIKTIAFLYSFYSKLWQIIKFKEKGLTPAQIQSKVGIKSSFYFNNLMKDARNYRSTDILVIFENLLDADKAIKGFSKLDAGSIFYMTIRKLSVRYS